MKDRFDEELKVGDEVLYVSGSRRLSFWKGKITRMTKCLFEMDGSGYSDCSPSRTVKLPEDKLCIHLDCERYCTKGEVT